jgi:predicted transcriptional regulator of viral defense system
MTALNFILRRLTHPEDNPVRGLSARERVLADAVAREERATITADDVIDLLDVPRATAGQILQRMTRKGWLVRVQRGLYAPVPLGTPTGAAVEDPWKLAMALYSPGYISGWSAAEHWDLTEQIFNSVCAVTTVHQRAQAQHHGGVDFLVAMTKPDRLFGTKKIWRGSSQVVIADPSRLVIDVLDSPVLGGGPRHTLDIVANYWRSSHVAPDLLLDYAERFGVGAVFKRLGFTAQAFGDVSDAWLRRCSAGMSKGISRLDPAGPHRGRIVTRWRMRINVPLPST